MAGEHARRWRWDRPGWPTGRAVRGLAVAQLALVVAVGALAYAGCLPIRAITFHGFDKIAHFALVGGAAACLDALLGFPSLRRGRLALPLAPLGLAALAAAEEALQLFAAHRTADSADLVADLLGVACLAALGRWIARRRARSLTRRAGDVSFTGVEEETRRRGEAPEPRLG